MSAEKFTVAPTARALLADLGIPAANVLRRALLPADLFARGPVTLTPDQYYAFWRALDDEAGDPNLPLAIGRAISAELFDSPIFAALCSPNLSVAAQRIASYKKLIEPMRLSVTNATDGTTLVYDWPASMGPPAVLVTTELVFWVALARIGTRSAVRPFHVSAPEPPADADTYRRFLGVTIDAGPMQSITFSAQDASRPFLTADERMWEFFEPELRRRLSALDDGASLAERVRGALLELLPAGRATMPATSRDLAVSRRTLQRRLRAEGTTFQAVLSATREALARHYLSTTVLTAGEISFLLGYEDPNSFYRAFHSWTGQTPDRARAMAA